MQIKKELTIPPVSFADSPLYTREPWGAWRGSATLAERRRINTSGCWRDKKAGSFASCPFYLFLTNNLCGFAQRKWGYSFETHGRGKITSIGK